MSFETVNTILNLGSFFIFMVVAAGLMIVYFTFHLLMKKFVRPYPFRWRVQADSLWQAIFWNFWIRTLIESYLELLIACLLNIRSLEYKTSADIFNIIVWGFGLLLTTFLPTYVIWFIFRWGTFVKFKKARISKKFGAIFSGLNTASVTCLWYIPLFVIRRLLFVCSILYLDKHPQFQVMTMVFGSSLVLMWLGMKMPFESKLLNYLEIFNEICILCSLYHMFLFTDFVPSPFVRIDIGNTHIAVTSLCLLVNVIVVAASSI